jgi:hypothetical protein
MVGSDGYFSGKNFFIFWVQVSISISFHVLSILLFAHTLLPGAFASWMSGFPPGTYGVKICFQIPISEGYCMWMLP